jgi:L-lactate utilization protein LutB
MEVASMHFKETAHIKLNDARLQHNLKKMQGKFVAHRRASLGAITRRHARRRQGDLQPTLENLGRLARAVRAQRVSAGATVLWAETPADVNARVLEIAARHGVRKIIKSKSMVSEESALDHAIESAGMQGRRDRPRRVHPADQQLRAAVAHHWPGAAQVEGGGCRALPQGARHAGQDGIEEPLPGSARRSLREHYLTADMGISAATSSSPKPDPSWWSRTKAMRR